VGRASVVVNQETETKVIIFHPKMLPGVVISDPALTLGLPPHVTAATGMDALAHCLEAYCAPSYHPMAEGIAVEGMRLVKTWLPTAYRDGGNLEARANMLAAASMGATAFQKGLGAIHSLSHPIGALYDTHHGLTNAVVMPYVLAFNRGAIEDKLTRLAAWLDLPDPSYVAVMDWVLALRSELGIAHTLKDIGVDDARADELSEMAAKDPTAPTNPVPIGAAELKAMFIDALEGRLA
jgi:alcohol dehydrogenase class IV